MQPSMAYRLRFLIDHVHPLNRGPYTVREIAEAVTKSGDETMVPIAVGQIRDILDGELTDPHFTMVQALANFFKVKIDVFGDDEETWNETEKWLTNLQGVMKSPRLAAARGLRRRDERRAQMLNRARGKNGSH